MLTKEDLQAIAELMDSRLETGLAPINDRLDSMQSDIKELKNDVKTLKADVAHIKKQTDVLYEWVDGIDLSVKDLLDIHKGA